MNNLVPRRSLPAAAVRNKGIIPSSSSLPLPLEVPHEDLSACTQHVALTVSGAAFLRLAARVYPPRDLPLRPQERRLVCPLRLPRSALPLLLQIQGKEKGKQFGE